MNKKSIITILTIGTFLISGCSSSSVSTKQIKKDMELQQIKNQPQLSENDIIINNDIQALQHYDIRKCYETTNYCGYGTNYIKGMFGMDSCEYTSGKIKRHEGSLGRALAYWVLSPFGLTLGSFLEIVTLQPFNSNFYDTHTKCEITDHTTVEKNLQDKGTFSGTITITTLDKTTSKKYTFNKVKLPLKLSLKNSNELIAATAPIDISEGYTINIDGVYNIDSIKKTILDTKTIKPE